MLLACVGGAVVLLLGGGALAGAVTTLTEGPYQVGKRPTPSSDAIDTLLPAKVGAFTRGDVNKVQAGEVNTTYTSGSTTIKVTAANYTSAGAAAGFVSNIADEINPSTPKPGINNKSSSALLGLSDTSYVRVVTAQGTARMAYSRGKFAFDVSASTEADLDSFMKDFPF